VARCRVREPPRDLADGDVLAAVRQHWSRHVDQVEHLPLGFGAHHWRASSSRTALFFVTLDGLGDRHTGASLEGAYASAAALAAAGLEFVLAPVPTLTGAYTVPVAGRVVSCTPWRQGSAAGPGPLQDRGLAELDVAVLARLHAAPPPPRIGSWRPLVDADFADALQRSVSSGWQSGPHGEPARRAVAGRLPEVRRWTARYHQLAAQAQSRPWVPTHGEPHTQNQLVTASGLVFVDWESLALAPRERDLRTLVDFGYTRLGSVSWPMIEMFDLEWRLDELAQYSAWFAHLHGDTASDRVAFRGLQEELGRPDWSRPSWAARA
jgi:spectinomycin phosphotransferase